MAKHLQATGLAFRVVVFFLLHPEEELTGKDIAVKFDEEPSDIGYRLNRAVADGLLAKKSDGPGRGKDALYMAGELLFLMRGEEPRSFKEPTPPPPLFDPHALGLLMQACASFVGSGLPAANVRVSAAGG